MEGSSRNGMPSASMTPPVQPWHRDSDLPKRNQIYGQIMRLFQHKKQTDGSNSREWEVKMPEFVKKLENCLYTEASSMAEYEDMQTLGQRLSAVAKRKFQHPRPSPTANSQVPQGSGGMLGDGSQYGNGVSSSSGHMMGGQGNMPFAHAGPRAGTHVSGSLPHMANGGNASNTNGVMYNDVGTPYPAAAGGSNSNGAGAGPAFTGVGGGGPAFMGSGTGTMVNMNALNTTEAGQNGSENRCPVAGPPVARMASGLPQTASEEDRRAIIRKQINWLLILHHASTCKAPGETCTEMQNCHLVRELWNHILNCKDMNCQKPRCMSCRELLRHHQKCRNDRCALCVPVRNALEHQRKQRAEKEQLLEQQQQQQQQMKAFGTRQMIPTPGMDTGYQQQQQQQQLMQQQSQQQYMMKQEYNGQIQQGMEGAQVAGKAKKAAAPRKSTAKATKATKGPQQQGNPEVGKKRGSSGATAAANKRAKSEKASTAATAKQEIQVCPPARPADGRSTDGMTLLECFSKDQIIYHVNSVALGLPPAEATLEPKKKAPKAAVTACSVCMRGTLTFEPAPVYCFCCGARIKRSQVYWTAQAQSMGQQQVKGIWCGECRNKASDCVEFEGNRIPKSQLEKKKNDEDQEEPWVECDGCGKWQHQICSLFNGRRNEMSGAKGKYYCPHCILQNIDAGRREPTPRDARHKAMLPASQLPETALSRFLGERLKNSLDREREVRARSQNLDINSVTGVDTNTLTIRTVLCTKRKTEVKSRFQEQYGPDGFPSSFKYQSKVVLLFQEIDGVDVLLFAMYVQEYDDICSQPNTRRVYLSYLDSVRYFKPDITSYRGDALRTYVYHDMLIGYLEYIKKLGYCNTYIWVCPPQEGDDYILYCHPSKQRVPKQEGLRKWYTRMLQSAKEENIVTSVTNVHETFLKINDGIAERSPTSLPYFEGDYWVGEAENILAEIIDGKPGKGKSGKASSSKGAGRKPPGSVGEPDISNRLMTRLSESLFNWRDDFLLVHLCAYCSECSRYISNGNRYESFEGDHDYGVCEECYAKLPPEKQENLIPEDQPPLPQIKDPDQEMQCEIFDTRESFLSLCQGAHYQFDTLRRAKHSSMMVLYHLHNPTAPSFVCTCNICNENIEQGRGFRCKTCTDFDVCDKCYEKNGHEHPVVRIADLGSNDLDQRRQIQEQQARRITDLLMHIITCRDPNCPSDHCRRVKAMFVHSKTCELRKTREGCTQCKHLTAMIFLHNRFCDNDECPISYCRALTAQRRRKRESIESRRRAAYAQYRSQQP